MGNLPSEKTLVLFCFLPFPSFHATWPGTALSPSTLALSSFLSLKNYGARTYGDIQNEYGLVDCLGPIALLTPSCRLGS